MNKLLYLVIVTLTVYVVFLSYEIDEIKNESKTTVEETLLIENKINGFSTDLTEIISSNESKIVGINYVVDNIIESSSSGVIWEKVNDEVYILTDLDVYVSDGLAYVLFDNGVSYSAEFVGLDEATRLLMLKVVPEFDVEVIAKGNSTLSKNGEWVIAMGSEEINDYYSALSVGVLSKVRQFILADLDRDGTKEWEMNLMQADISISQGNSGGPVINLAGEMIGMSKKYIAAVDDFGVSILPINEISLVAGQLMNKGTVNRLNLGLNIIDIPSLLTYEKSSLGINLDITAGVYVSEVVEDSLADTIGLKEGDVIVMIDDMNINSYNSYRRFLYESNSKISHITIQRNNEKMELMVNLDD